MTTEYIAYPWPEYQEYMGEEWFRKECYYCADKDIYFIPINRVNTTSTDNGLGIMKKLTIADKAKAYDKALKRAKEKYPTCYSPALLEYIFPELKENDDKEIREDIISNLKRYITCIKDGYDAPSAKNFVIKTIEKQIAWLKLQGNKPTNIDVDFLVSLYKRRLKSQGNIENNFLVTVFRRGVENIFEELNPKRLEKKGEQEFIDSDTLIQQRVDTLADIDTKQSSADDVKPKVKNEIEIPFGAKDSELQEATYYIPKGFYAEIDNDKVVIKKGEKPINWSEDDERIKKRLINLVNEIYNNTNYITFLEHKELLAWLEKLDDNAEL